MILTCPNCSTRFKFPKEGLGKTGIKVRCTECLEVWRQNPEGDEESAPTNEAVVKDEAEETDGIVSDTKTEFDDDLEMAEAEKSAQDSVDNLFDSIEEPDLDDITPENTAVKNEGDEDSESAAEETGEEDGSNDQNNQEDESEEESTLEFREKENTDPKASNEEGSNRPIREKIPDKRVVSFGAAGAVFLLTFIILILIRGPLMQSYPSMHGFYGLFGMGTNLLGEDLVFDQITSNITKNELHIEGKIVNLSSDIRDVPLIEASIRGKDHHSKEIWYILPPKDALGGEEELHFTSVYHVEKKLTDSFKKENDIHFRFVLKKPNMEMRSRAQQEEETLDHNEAHDDTAHEKEGHEDDYHQEDTHNSETHH